MDFPERFLGAFESDLELDGACFRVVVAVFLVAFVFPREWLLFRDAESERPEVDFRPLRLAAWESSPEDTDLDLLAFLPGFLVVAPALLFRVAVFWLLVLEREAERDLARAERLGVAPLLDFFAGILSTASALPLLATVLRLRRLEPDLEREPE